ncbi:MAG: sugar phosphate isomerase/epimerase [Clostridia bacterium]|nr:sugar phosphate isomerase/epimerase [Clostridia bacterium]
MSNPLGISVGQANYQLLPQYAAAGFEAVEISLPGKPIDELRVFACEAYALLRKAGMTLWSVHLPFGRRLDISALDEAERARVIGELKLSVDLARGLGAQTLVVHGSSEPNEEESRPARMEACAKSLRELQACADGMNLAIENLPRTCIGRAGWEVAQLSRECAGVCFDVNHLLIEDHNAFLDAAEKRVVTTHLSDYDGVDERHWLPGMGIVPWKLVHDRLIAAGYEGPFLFELGLDAEKRPYAPERIVSTWRGLVER